MRLGQLQSRASRLTGKPGVCIATLGPGALNFSTGAAYALLGAMPMIMITGQKGILSSPQAGFQVREFGIVKILAPTKVTIFRIEALDARDPSPTDSGQEPERFRKVGSSGLMLAE